MDLSSHGIVALIRNTSGQFLLLEDSRKQMLGYWAPPHGRCESTDLSEESSVIRETREETGLIVKPVKKLLTQPADTKVQTISFWLVNLLGGEIKIDASETSNHGWFTMDEALGMKLYPGTKSFFEKIKVGQISLD
jgi:ADP-ribose pyrophosphatase YjhB (NUDIX family)